MSVDGEEAPGPGPGHWKVKRPGRGESYGVARMVQGKGFRREGVVTVPEAARRSGKVRTEEELRGLATHRSLVTEQLGGQSHLIGVGLKHRSSPCHMAVLIFYEPWSSALVICVVFCMCVVS